MTTLFDVLFHVNTSELERASQHVQHLGTTTDHVAEGGEHLSEVFEGMGGAIGGAVEHVTRFNNTIGHMLQSMDHFAQTNILTVGGLGKFNSALLSSIAVTLAFAAALGAVGLAMAFHADQHIEEMNNLAEEYGYAASQMDLMTDAAKHAGSSVGSVEQVYTKVAKAAYMATNVVTGTGRAFHDLGINIHDSSGQLKSSEELTTEAIEKWESGSKTTADLAAMNAILGKSWQQNIPGLKAVADAQKMANDFQQQGIGISKESIAAEEAHTKSSIMLHGIMSDVGSILQQIVIPAFTTLTNWLVRSYEKGGLVSAAFKLLETGTWALMIPIRLLMGIFITLDTILTTVGKGIGALAASLVAFAHGNFSEGKNIWADYFKDTKNNVVDLKNSLVDLYKQQAEGPSPNRTIEKPKEGFYSHAGGTEQTGIIIYNKQQQIVADMYAKYLDTLNKITGVQQRLNQEQKSEIEIKRLNVEYAQKLADVEAKNVDIRARNAATLKRGTGTIVQEIDIKSITAAKDKEIAQIRARSALIDDEHVKNMVEVEDYKQMTDMVFNFNKSIDDEIRHRRMTQDEIRKENEIRLIEKKYQDDVAKIANDNLLTAANRTGALVKLEQQRAEAIANVTKEMNKLNDANKDWLANGVNSFITGLGTVEAGLEKLTVTGLTGFTDSLTKLITTGKGGFKEMIASMIDDLIKLMIQLTVVKPLLNMFQQSSFGSTIMGAAKSLLVHQANGGVWDGGVQMFAAGGVISSPTAFNIPSGGMGVIGEAGPEAIMPLSRGNNGKLGISLGGITQQGMGGMINNHNYSINVSGAANPAETARQVADSVKRIQLVADQRLSKQLKQGGLLNNRPVNAF